MTEINSLNSLPNESVEFSKKIKDSDTPTYNSLFDTNRNGVIEISEQKIGILKTLNKLSEIDINKCFDSDITYNQNDENSAKMADQQVKTRQQKAIALAESTKYFNQEILDKGS